MKAAIAALAFLTRMPLPAVATDRIDHARAIRWFPLAGLVVGSIVAIAGGLGHRHDPWLGALLALAAWVAITGALHLDGLGDMADAAGAAHADRERLSAVLADPHIGSFGVVAIALQLIAKLVLLRMMLDGGQPWALVAIPALARIGPLAWSLVLPPLHEGLGTLFRDGARWWAVAIWAIILAPPAALLAPGMLPGLAFVAVWPMWVRARIGGISGDGHGAGIELSETAMLATWALLR